MKKMALTLLGAVAMSMSGVAAAQEMTNDQFMEKLRSALAAHPEIVAQAMQLAQSKQQEAQQSEMNSRALAVRPELIAATSPGIVLGNPKGTQTVVEFLDYRCGYCQKMHDPVNELLAENGNARLVVMMRPVLGPDSEVLARYALAANLQGKFKVVHDELYKTQYKTDDAGLAELSKKTGVNWSKAKADMTGPVVGDRLAKQIAYAEQLQVQGTPYFITPTTVIPGATDKGNLLR